MWVYCLLRPDCPDTQSYYSIHVHNMFIFNIRLFGGEGKVPPASKKVLDDLPTSLIGPTEAGKST